MKAQKLLDGCPDSQPIGSGLFVHSRHSSTSGSNEYVGIVLGFSTFTRHHRDSADARKGKFGCSHPANQMASLIRPRNNNRPCLKFLSTKNKKHSTSPIRNRLCSVF